MADDFDGVIDPDAEWADVPQLSVQAQALGGAGGPMNAQAVALAARTKELLGGLNQLGGELEQKFNELDGELEQKFNELDGELEQKFNELGGELEQKFNELGGEDGASNLGFKQAGDGAVDRTVLDKLRDVVTLQDFGAKGDGATDDSAVIQAVFDNPDVKVIDGLGKTYYVAAPLTITRSNVTLRNIEFVADALDANSVILTISGSTGAEQAFVEDSDANSSTVVVSDGNGFPAARWAWLRSQTTFSTAGTVGELVEVHNRSGNTLQLRWATKLPYTVAGSATATILNMRQGITLEDVTIRGSLDISGLRGIMIDKAVAPQITNLRSYNIQRAHLTLSTCAHAKVTGCTFNRTGTDVGLNYGIVVSNSCYDVQIADCSAIDTRHAVTIGGATGVNRFVKVIGCHSAGALDAGFDAHPQTIEHSFIDCTVDFRPTVTTGDGIVSQGTEFFCRGCTVLNAPRYGVLVQPINSVSGLIQIVNVRDAYITSKDTSSVAAVYVTTANTPNNITHLGVSGIHARNGFTNGIALVASDGGISHFTVTDNTVATPGQYGLRVRASGPTVTSGAIINNRFTMPAGSTYGIYLNTENSGTIANTRLGSNHVSGTGSTGLRVDDGCTYVITDGSNLWRNTTATDVDPGASNVTIRES